VKFRPLPERPPGFIYKSSGIFRGRELFAEGASVSAIAKKFGTPVYVYSAEAIRCRFADFDKAFAGERHTICYSVKANSNLTVLKLLAKLGAGFDVVSGGELQRVLAADRKAAGKVVFSGVGKQAEEIDLALHSNILLFNVESASELRLLAARAAHLRKRAAYAVRVNPGVNAQTHPYISTGLHEHKFGVPLHNARELYSAGLGGKYLRAAGVSAHIGSQITELSTFREAMEKVAELVTALCVDGYHIRYVDAGGGLGISYRSEESRNFNDGVRAYAAAVAGPLRKLDIHLLLEPGRSIVAPAGILVTRIVFKKTNDGKLFLVTDAAMNDLLRPALYDAYHEIVPVTARRGANDLAVDVVGPICESSDFFARGRELPQVDEGDLLAVLDTGAYGMSLASNYNTRPRAAEVLVNGRRARLIRRRETINDLLAPERA
jgi:diaminopimelate decarboxylase